MPNSQQSQRRLTDQGPAPTPEWSCNRRQVLAAATTSLAASVLCAQEGHEPTPRCSLGLVMYCCSIQRRALLAQHADRDLFEPLAFMRHCRDLNVGGMQINLGVRSAKYCASLRGLAEEHGMFVEAIVRAPFEAGDLDRFAAEAETAANCGAIAIRTTIIPGRRYEYFTSLQQFHEFANRGEHALRRAAPIVERCRIPLAVENHKDQRIDERVRLFEQISSEYVGACVDTGNNLALLEDPLATVRALAPWAHCVHLKDQAVARCETGFLLGDTPLGQGCVPLAQVVEVLVAARPKIHFCLELITRDPLEVPVLTPGYWVTLPDVPAVELAHMLDFVQQRQGSKLQYITPLDADRQLQLELDNIQRSVTYAREELRMTAS